MIGEYIFCQSEHDKTGKGHIIFDDAKGIKFHADTRVKVEALAAQGQKDPWCYDMDKLPEDAHILIWLGNHHVIQAFQDEEGVFRHSYSGDIVSGIDKLKAWMPIPEPKKG